MFKLINRISWFLSFTLGLAITIYIDNDFFILGLILGLIIKFLFLSENFIKSRLIIFSKSLSDNYLKQSNSSLLSFKNENIVGKDINKFDKNNSSNILGKNLDSEQKTEFFKAKENKEIVKEDFTKASNNFSKLKSEAYKKAPKNPSKLSIPIKKFFSENLLAKLGGILVFLGVLFLLSLVYSGVGAVGKLIIGFLIGFSIYIAGIFLEKKGLKNEAIILFGIGILINYLVILGGRYIIGDNFSDNNILSIGTTFLFLILNTIFAVVTSLVYKSRTLLLFSFIFAYLNPLLVGGSSDTPYTVLGYALIVSFGGLYLSFRQKDSLLAIGVFILANILVLKAGFSSDIDWILKLISSTVISISSIFVIYKIDLKHLSSVFLGSYVFLILLIGNGDSHIKETTSFISYMISILLYFSIGIYYFLKTSFNSLIYLLLFPILIISGLSFSGDLLSIPLSLAIIVLIYLIGFIFLKEKLANSLKYIFFVVLGIYIFLTNSFLKIESINLDLTSFITVLIVSFVFIFTSYYLSKKKGLESLYSIGTIGGILSIAPIIVFKYYYPESEIENSSPQNIFQILLSIISIIIFAILNLLLPFVNKNLIKKGNLKNLIIGLILGLLFFGYELFIYGSINFPGISLGFSFLILAVIYFILSYMMLNKLSIDNIKKDDFSKNTIYSYLAISISVFSFSIALVFSSYEAIISTIWLFEASIMFYFFYKTREIKIFIAGLLLFMIGVIKLFGLLNLVEVRDFIFLIPFAIIYISFILNLKFLNNIFEEKVLHDILHILGIGALGLLLLEIIPNTGKGWSILALSLFLSVSGIVYSYFNSKLLKYFFVFGLIGFSIMHIVSFDYLLPRLERYDFDFLIALQYISTLLLLSAVYIWNKLNKQKILNIIVNIIFALYLLIITSQYIYEIFNTTFAITIYWGISSFLILYQGISKDLIKFRTIGLYFISLTVLKVFFYDIWYGIDNAISRVVALIVIGILFIIISTKYTKKYGNNIAKEFSMKNLKDKDNIKECLKNSHL